MDKVYFIELSSKQCLEMEDGHRLGAGGSSEHKFVDAGLHPEHLVLTSKNGNHFIQSLSTIKATYLNKQKISSDRKYLIRNGDEVRCGQLVFQISATPELEGENEDQFEDEFGTGMNLGNLKLDLKQEAPEIDVLENMKKSRKIITDLQETKKQIEDKLLELQSLLKQQKELSAEISEVESFVGENRDLSAGEMGEMVIQDQTEIELIDFQIEQNKRALRELEAKKLVIQEQTLVKKAMVEKLNQLADLSAEFAHLKHAIEVFEHLKLSEKLQQLTACLSAEQSRYKDLHFEYSVSSQNKKIKRFG